MSETEKYLFGLRENDTNQKEDSAGPGDHYRNWLKQNNLNIKYRLLSTYF